jgi:hypothetical protein
VEKLLEESKYDVVVLSRGVCLLSNSTWWGTKIAIFFRWGKTRVCRRFKLCRLTTMISTQWGRRLSDTTFTPSYPPLAWFRMRRVSLSWTWLKQQTGQVQQKDSFPANTHLCKRSSMLLSLFVCVICWCIWL